MEDARLIRKERWDRLIRLNKELHGTLDSYDHAIVRGYIQGLEDEQFGQLIERAEILATALAGITNDLRIKLESEHTAQEAVNDYSATPAQAGRQDPGE